MTDGRRSLSTLSHILSKLETIFTSNQLNKNFTLGNEDVPSNTLDNNDMNHGNMNVPFYRNPMRVIDPSLELRNSFDQRSQAQLEADIAYALKLQEEEYGKNHASLPQVNQQSLTNVISVGNSLIVTDEDFAAHLQAEENHQQHNKPQVSHPTTNQYCQPRRTANVPRASSTVLLRPRPPRPAQHSRFTDDVTPFSVFSIPTNQGVGDFPYNHHFQGGHIQNQNPEFGPDDYENLLELDANVNKQGLSEDQINRLPTEQFHHIPNKNSEERTCSICMDAFEEKQTLRRLACFHRYHKDCIDNWLRTKDLCPICRTATMQNY